MRFLEKENKMGRNLKILFGSDAVNDIQVRDVCISYLK